MLKRRLLLLFILLWSDLWSENNITNALINEHSPYLQQHVHNPVNWYPWGKEAFEKAKKENKLIFLSIGYSTCHWCHVMEEESFTDKEVAKLLNDSFVSIKVDREEYPQIDKKYQQLYMKVFDHRGGWPLSLFLSPDKEVFFMGVYIPKEKGYGSKGLMNLLPSFIQLQKNNTKFLKAIQKYKEIMPTRKLHKKPSTEILLKSAFNIEKQFDSLNGGFASRPKFPEASKIDLLLDIYRLNGNKKALYMAEYTLTKMAESGLYDQIGGGFFRYTTDYAWQIPHFEKMLYTNAELISVYVKAYLMTGNKCYRKIVDESIAQMEKNYMQEGRYFSASDADSDGEEGGYFIHEYMEVQSALEDMKWKPKEIADVLAYMGIEEDGNIDGDFSLPHITRKDVPVKLEELKAYLKSQSDKRTFPFVDKKIITAWNAMMVKALFDASKMDEKYLNIAKKRLDILLHSMRINGVLYHQTLIGKIPTQKALLEDYAFLIDTLIVGYEKTYNKNYIALIKILTTEALNKFYRQKIWYLSNDGIEAYADFSDRYYTSALSVMLDNLVRASMLIENLEYMDIVKESIHRMGGVLETHPEDSSKLVHTSLRLSLGDIIIHAKKKRLKDVQKYIDGIKYPFVLSAVEKSNMYLACKATMCFASDKNITKLIQKIEKAVK